LATAEIVHRLPGRVRLAFPDRRDDRVFFLELKRELERWDDVLRVNVRPLTASALVIHTGEFERIVERAEARGLFSCSRTTKKEEEISSLERLASAISDVDATIRGRSDGRIGLETAAFWCLLAAGVRQTIRGDLFPAATPLFISALSVLDKAMKSEVKVLTKT
jgi:hypothetical protein